MKIGATIRKSVSSCNQRVASIYGRCKRGEALARKELYELYAPAMMSVCVPVNLVINLWDNPDWNVYVSGGAA